MRTKPLFVIDKDDTFAADLLKSKGIKDIVSLDYRKMYEKNNVKWIGQICKTKGIDFLVFSRNDQVKDRINIGGLAKNHKLGYTTFSSLENNAFEENTLSMLNDLLNINTEPSKGARTETIPKKIDEHRTFSLIFDTEQLGCMKFGVPRLLEMLKKHKIKATFFMTNIARQIYPEIASAIAAEGHEIGLHGECHEFLQGKTKEYQEQKISRMISDIGKTTSVFGANFIGRYDNNTLDGMISRNLKYFVFDIMWGQPFSTISLPRLRFFRVFILCCSGTLSSLSPWTISTGIFIFLAAS